MEKSNNSILSDENNTGNCSKQRLCDVLLTDNDFSLVNVDRRGMVSFGIERLSESIFNDEKAYELERFLNENGIYADIFNVEYMGFLTGQVKIERSKINDIIPLINDFIKNIT